MGATMLGLRIFRRRRVCRALEDGECCARCWQGLAEGSRGGWARCRGRWEIGVGKRHFGNTFAHFFPRIVDTGHSDFFQRRHPNHPHSTSTPPSGPFRARQQFQHSQTLCQAPEALNDHARSQHMTKAQAQNLKNPPAAPVPPEAPPPSPPPAQPTAQLPAQISVIAAATTMAAPADPPTRTRPRQGATPPTATTRTHAAGKARTTPPAEVTCLWRPETLTTN